VQGIAPMLCNSYLEKFKSLIKPDRVDVMLNTITILKAKGIPFFEHVSDISGVCDKTHSFSSNYIERIS
jgi:hypothetical protein